MEFRLSKITSLAKNKYFWVVFFISILGLFLRSYHHKDLLFFEVDQARDWRIVEIAQQYGVGELPLLGPGMNASTLRIGPIYHYIQYLTAFFLGNAPEVLAYPDLIFSILTIPLFYFLLREFFSRRISVSLVLIFSCSLFAIEHGRFAMNSNSLPFFTLLTLYPLLRFSREKEKNKKWLWTLLFAFSFGIAIQLHALTFFALPAIILTYLLSTKTKVSWKQCLVGFLIIFFLNSPVVFNEIMTKFEIIKSVRSGLDSREVSGENFSFAKRIIKNSQEIVRNYTLILTSKDVIDSLDPEFKPEGGLDMIKRNLETANGRKTLLLSFLATLFFLLPARWLFRQFILSKKLESQKRNFLILLFIWQMVFLAVYLFIIYVQHARYYLPVIFVPFIFLGVYFEKIGKKTGKAGLYLIVFFFLAVNLFWVGKWFRMIEKYASPDIKTIELNEYIQDPFYIVNLKQIRAVNTYIESVYAREKSDVFLVAPKQFYARSVRFLLIYKKNIPTRVFSTKTRDKEKAYFLINSINTPLENINLTYTGFFNDFEIIDSKSFGTLIVYLCQIKNSVPHKPASRFNLRDTRKKSPSDDKHLITKYNWNQFLNYIKISGNDF